MNYFKAIVVWVSSKENEKVTLPTDGLWKCHSLQVLFHPEIYVPHETSDTWDFWEFLIISVRSNLPEIARSLITFCDFKKQIIEIQWFLFSDRLVVVYSCHLAWAGILLETTIYLQKKKEVENEFRAKQKYPSEVSEVFEEKTFEAYERAKKAAKQTNQTFRVNMEKDFTFSHFCADKETSVDFRICLVERLLPMLLVWVSFVIEIVAINYKQAR